jgi:uncharacterized membrane protein
MFSAVVFRERGGMSQNGVPRALFVVILLAAIAQAIYAFPQMPERMASHFAASGAPNGWMTKEQFFIVYAITFLPALFVEFCVGRRISKTSEARINLPNKEYWLAPERRGKTFAYFETFFAWYGCALLLLLVFVFGLAMQANLSPEPRLPTAPALTAVAAFVLFNVAAIVAMLRRFSTARS